VNYPDFFENHQFHVIYCVREERKFPSSPATAAKITKVGHIQLYFGWAHTHPGNRLSNLKILARYLFIPFLNGLLLLRETTF
jgi:hypothetical protein